jgi:hypothetical protein
MSINLVTMLERLGMTHKPRFTVEETAEILGIRRDQVMDLLKRGKLIGVKSSSARWSGVFAVDLDKYIQVINRVNAPNTPCTADCNAETNIQTNSLSTPSALGGGMLPTTATSAAPRTNLHSKRPIDL